MTDSRRTRGSSPKTLVAAVESRTGSGTWDYQRGHQAHSVCHNCGSAAAIAHILRRDGEYLTVYECGFCGSLGL